MPLRIRDEHGELTTVATDEAMAASTASATPSAGWTAGFASQLVDSVRQAIMSYGPVAPGITIESPRSLRCQISAGDTTEISFVIKNRQHAATMVGLRLTPAFNESGVCWTPEHRLNIDRPLLMPFEETAATLAIDVPTQIDVGDYQASLRMLGVNVALPVSITIGAASG